MRVSPLTRSHHADPVGPDAVVQTSLLRRSKKGGGLRVISHPTPSTPTQPIREASSCLQSFSSRGPRVGGHLPDVTFPSVPSLGGLVPKPETWESPSKSLSSPPTPDLFTSPVHTSSQDPRQPRPALYPSSTRQPHQVSEPPPSGPMRTLIPSPPVLSLLASNSVCAFQAESSFQNPSPPRPLLSMAFHCLQN